MRGDSASAVRPTPAPNNGGLGLAQFRTLVECAVKGAIPQRVRTPPGNCRSSR